MKFLQRYLVLTLALLITLSATGTTLSLHTCCGKIKHFSIFGKPESCKMDKSSKAVNATEAPHIVSKKKCCDNKNVSIQKTSEATANKTQVTEKKGFDVLFILNFVRSWFGANQAAEEDDEEETQVSWRFYDSLIILLRHFRI